MTPFHYAFKVKDIASTRAFYVDLLGCEEGRSTEDWIDFNFFGHQLSAHISTDMLGNDYCGKVDGVAVPIPHFGCLLKEAQFLEIQKRLELGDVEFIIQPQIQSGLTTYQKENELPIGQLDVETLKALGLEHCDLHVMKDSYKF